LPPDFDFSRGVYSPRIAAKIARIPYQSFAAWARAHLVQAKPFEANGRVESTYTYQDLLLIRLIVRLKGQGAKPKGIRAALDMLELVTGTSDAWIRSAMAVEDGYIVAWIPDHPDWRPLAARQGPEKALNIVFFPQLIKELKNELVPPDRFPYVEVDPGVLGGVPVVKGTRISTRAVAVARESGLDPQDTYPTLTAQQIANAEAYEKFLLEAA